MSRLHTKARENNARYPTRLVVPDEKVPWVQPWDDYNPPNFTHEKVLEQHRFALQSACSFPENSPACTATMVGLIPQKCPTKCH